MRVRVTVVKLLVACAFACGLLALASCQQAELERKAEAMTGGDTRRGVEAIRRYGCATCHTIPGVPGATALVGPNLQQVASRMYLAGVLPNTPDNMVRWIQHPRDVDPLTAMPNLNVTDGDARDIASYLYTLK
ncbi:MAG TPA: c-type cytochrome [Pyrinomonadaceae bacterium]|jgi:cytochrome c2|nr:c-type cytochrome [Pyrinomonadaceae bacterium]